MTSAPPIGESFARILRWADFNLPLLRASLRPPASESEIDAFEALIGRTLPQDVRDLYRLADGQIPFQFYPGIFLSLPFNPLGVVTRDWRFAVDAIQHTESNTDEFLSSFPPGAVRALHYNTAWVPISDDAGGNHLAIDLDPGPAGNVGQLIITGTDEQERVRVAPSLGVFLHWAAGEMEAGNFAPARSEERPMSDADRERFSAGLPVVVADDPSEDDWRWRNEGHLHDGLRNYLKSGGQIG